MKKTNKLWLALLLTVLVAALLAVGFTAAAEEPTLDAVLASAKTRRYALSRIRRMLLCACLEVEAGMADGVPPYARVLAADERGRALLHERSRRGEIPVLTKPASVRDLLSAGDGSAERI